MDSNHQKWPNSWDYHISQYCNFYFCDKDIKYMDQNFWTETRTNRSDTKVTTMDLKFQISNHHYLVSISHSHPAHFFCSVFYRKPFKNSNGRTDLHISCFEGEDIFSIEDVAGIGGHNMTVIELMDFAEQMMWGDYNRRENNNDDDDDDDDDGENDPIEPFSPTLQSTLITI